MATLTSFWKRGKRARLLRSLAPWLGLKSWLGPAASSTASHKSHPKKGPGWRAHVADELRDGLATVLFLVALATALHESHILGGLTAQSMRLVHVVQSRGPLAPRWDERVTPPLPPPVTIFHVTESGFEQMFCGFSPTPRAALAMAIDMLSQGIPPELHAVVAIDVDIGAPMERAIRLQKCPNAPRDESGAYSETEMVRALTGLRQVADVVTITTPRFKASDRASRNRSLRAICASGVRLATPFALIDAGEPDYRFFGKSESKGGGAPRFAAYPSLGNVLALSACAGSAGCEGGPIGEIERSSGAKDLCPFASGDAMLPYLDDVGGPRSGSVAPDKMFKWLYLDLLRSSVWISTRNVSWWEDLEIEVSDAVSEWMTHLKTAQARSGEPTSPGIRPVFVLSIDDGFSDRHFSVMDRSGTSTGDFLTATRALSLIEPLESPTGRLLWKSALFDLCIGLVYLLLWSSALYYLSPIRAARYSTTWGVLVFLGPAAMTSLLGYGALLYAANALHHSPPAWNDPVLVLLGLTVHAYMTIWEQAREHGAVASSRPLPTADHYLWRTLQAGRLAFNVWVVALIVFKACCSAH